MNNIITRNAIQCKHCGDVIESTYRHDFKWCSCRTCAIDGGHNYLKRCYKNSPEEDFIDLSEAREEEYEKLNEIDWFDVI